ncbi:MAG: GNAT family N-acetyltransferase [Burkholderiales bacterium]|nr:GNAT family N-acetyltransferase [Burkholderiales bacterium]
MDTAIAAAPDAGTRTYTIHRYPTQLIDRWELEDGRVVTLRPVLPQDGALEQDFVRGLSAQSRYARFLASVTELPPRLIAYLTAIDYVRHLALVAEVTVYGTPLLVGDARYVLDAPAAGAAVGADFAIAVADDWQASGIGSRLLRGLEGAARAAGVARLHGDVLGSNRKALAFMTARGFSVRPHPEEARLVRVEKDLRLAPGSGA